MTASEAQLMRIESLLRVLVETQKPQISFAEIHRRLGYGSKSTTLRWIKNHKVTKVGPRAYSLFEYVAAATNDHGKSAA